MSDHIGTSYQGATPSGQGQSSGQGPTSRNSLAEQATSAGRDFANKAKDIADHSKDTIKVQASDFVDAAKDMASQATDKLKGAVNDQKSAGAAYVGTLAHTMRRAAQEFDKDLPMAGTCIRKAASQIEGVSDHIRNGNLNDVVRNAQSFARRQPTAFLGLAVLAGFGAVRFLKSSSGDEGSDSASKPMGGRSSEDNRGYRDDFAN